MWESQIYSNMGWFKCGQSLPIDVVSLSFLMFSWLVDEQQSPWWIELLNFLGVSYNLVDSFNLTSQSSGFCPVISWWLGLVHIAFCWFRSPGEFTVQLAGVGYRLCLGLLRSEGGLPPAVGNSLEFSKLEIQWKRNCVAKLRFPWVLHTFSPVFFSFWKKTTT